MEQSIIHIKAPHTIHIGAKAKAAMEGTSMNQYIIGLIETDLEDSGFKHNDIATGINLYRDLTGSKKPAIPLKPKVIKTPKQAAKIAAEQTTVSDARKVCPVHGTPMDTRGRCLAKKCKYS